MISLERVRGLLHLAWKGRKQEACSTGRPNFPPAMRLVAAVPWHWATKVSPSVYTSALVAGALNEK